MFSHVFIDRPIFATVLSIVIVIVGAVAFWMLPIAQYPEVAPPTITVTANYPGANAKVVADTVATPIEQEVNGVENMIYMSSRCTNDGQMLLDVTFELGTNLDMAQVPVQNRVKIAEAKLPEDVKRQGVTTKKKSPSILLCVNLISEKETDPETKKERFKFDQLYLSNYATNNVKDELARVKGVGDVTFLGMLAQPQLLLRGLAFFLAGSFLIDGIGKIVAAIRRRAAGASWKWMLVSGVVNGVLALVLVVHWPVSGRAVVVILVGIRMLTAGWSVLLGREHKPKSVAELPPRGLHPDRRLRLPTRPEFASFEESLQAEESNYRWINAVWCWTFVIVFFAIHIGRMRVEWNLVGMIAPLVAAVGDVATALIIAFGIILPCRLAWRRMLRPMERRAWERLLARSDQGRGPGVLGRLYRAWLMARLRFSFRMARARYSPRAALRWGLQVGLPATAILIAVNPIWGFSWFFNSESWTTGIWDHWAAARTDTWREQMVLAVERQFRQTNIPNDRLFQVEPEGVAGNDDFSFLVLGDTGEGGAAQHSLRDQYLFLGRRPDVKFLVISSDVIYPSGAMSDYEPKFYLPFKGFSKPIYAVPGNHDWYDALEAFAANFFEADAARTCMRSRLQTDAWLTTTTESRIEALIREAARLRREFGVSTGWQRGPFFEVQTERFALIAVDTGVLRQVDTAQWQWLKAALKRSKGKFTMVIPGHPLYAGGRYQGGEDEPPAGEWAGEDSPSQVAGRPLRAEVEPFAALHSLLREHQVEVVMAGDTHYFEHYQETYLAEGRTRTMYHFVNGGGGAYISIGTPLDWPSTPAVPDCAFFPRRDFLIQKLDRETPAWKAPLWQWTKRFRAWPFTAETLAGAFSYNQAPYLQSFVEVRVERSNNQVRLIPHGADGPLRWGALETFGSVMPPGKSADDLVEFAVAMPARRQP
jgi:hypothetical protein